MTKRWITALVTWAALLLVALCVGRSCDVDRDCISCTTLSRLPTTVVECEPQRCPMGPVLWSDVFKSPKQGGFTVAIPEGHWMVSWKMGPMGPPHCGVCGAIAPDPCDICAHEAHLCPKETK